MQVKPGYRVELVAAEPLVRDPVAFDWGPDGKLWVAEMADYPLGVGPGEETDNADASLRSPVAPRQESRHGTDTPSPINSAKKVDSRSADPVAERQGYKKGGGRVRFLEDTDGDGKYDKSTLFLDKLNFPNGVMAWRDGVLISAAPEVLFARDTNGDGRADEVKVLLTGFGEGNQQHRVNGFSWGLDNMVHCANGDSGGQIRVEGRVMRGEENKKTSDSLTPHPSPLAPSTSVAETSAGTQTPANSTRPPAKLNSAAIETTSAIGSATTTRTRCITSCSTIFIPAAIHTSLRPIRASKYRSTPARRQSSRSAARSRGSMTSQWPTGSRPPTARWSIGMSCCFKVALTFHVRKAVARPTPNRQPIRRRKSVAVRLILTRSVRATFSMSSFPNRSTTSCITRS